MDQIQKALFSIIAVILAGIWGYSGDSFALKVKSWTAGVTSSSQQASPEASSSESESPASSAAIDSTPYQQQTATPATVPTSTQRAVTKSAVTANPTPPTNPYAAMSAGNLKSTLGTMAPSSAAPQRSNAYFDKLSQQLRDLQGEAPPPAVDETEEDQTATVENSDAPEMQSEENPDYAAEANDVPLDEVQGEELDDELEEILIEEGY